MGESELKVQFTELYDRVRQEINEGVTTEVAKLERRTHVMKVKRTQILESLNDTIKEVEEKHRDSVRFWKKVVAMYGEFIQKNPGSTQMRPPDPAPKRPANLQDIKSYVKLFSSLSEEEIELELQFLREIFNISARVVEEAVRIRSDYLNASTGSAGIYALGASASNVTSGNTITGINWNARG